MTTPTDDHLDALIRAAARDYNRPGEPPREAMWGRIHAARAAKPVGTGSAGVPGFRVVRSGWLRTVVGIAAVLVVGVMLGRMYERASATHRPGLIASARPSERRGSTGTAPASDSVPTTARGGGSLTRGRQEGGSTAYRLATLQHLAQTEAMLTSFRAAAKGGQVDAQLTMWARDLLTTTRMLQSSPVTQDLTMQRLLDDLELVLVQITQYTSTGPHHSQELDLIEHSIEHRGVIGKLRTTIPVGLTPVGT